MMKIRFRAPLAGLLVLAGYGSLPAQESKKAPDLAITRVVLFSSGVGYFQRDGAISGKTSVPLQFAADQINL